MKCVNQIVIILTIICCIAGCASIAQPMPVLNGMIYDFDNEPVAGVKIVPEDGREITSDIYGHFRIEHLKNMTAYTITLSKKDYEPQTVQFEYSDTAQILYVQMYSAEQLLTAAERHLQQKEYSSALSYLDRSALAGGSPVAVGYLRAITAVLLQDFEKAVMVLEQLVSDGYSEPYIALLLADIYQYKLADAENAKKYLQLFLDNSYNPAAADRLYALQQ